MKFVIVFVLAFAFTAGIWDTAQAHHPVAHAVHAHRANEVLIFNAPVAGYSAALDPCVSQAQVYGDAEVVRETVVFDRFGRLRVIRVH